MSDDACRSELVQRGRRGELSPAEQSALAAHLAACEACRLTQRLGRDFDDSARLEAGDGERITALAELARRWAANGDVKPPARKQAARAARGGWRHRAVALAAAIPLFMAAAASAAWGVYRASTSEATAPAPAPPAVTAAPPPAPEQAPAREAPTPAPAAPPVIQQERPEIATVRPRAAESAAERFERANATRRSGDPTRAITLYRELQRDFPASPEAAASELRLGNLLLERGKASAALDQFDRHLRRSSALAPEALYGRGRAQAALDQPDAERQTWSRMLREYPGSPYAAHAKRRVEALGTADGF